MNWKDFLKPTDRKLIVFMVFIILAFLTSGFIWGPPPSIFTDVCSLILMFLVLPVLSVLEYFEGLIGGFLTLFGLFIYWYLLSCLIVWIYDKFKKKSKRK